MLIAVKHPPLQNQCHVKKDLNDSTQLHRRFDHEPNKPMIERTGAAKVMGCSEKSRFESKMSRESKLKKQARNEHQKFESKILPSRVSTLFNIKNPSKLKGYHLTTMLVGLVLAHNVSGRNPGDRNMINLINTIEVTQKMNEHDVFCFSEIVIFLQYKYKFI